MVYRDAGQRYPIAAYLYVLHLDEPALAWEYLRRNPDYRRDWADRLRQGMAGNRWGLSVLEDPELDARDAHPVWLADQPGLVQLYPDLDPMPDATAFDVWSIPGRKCLIHDGRCLRVLAALPGGRAEAWRRVGCRHAPQPQTPRSFARPDSSAGRTGRRVRGRTDGPNLCSAEPHCLAGSADLAGARRQPGRRLVA